ncbi:ubiquitin-conjugating enzyme family protein [Endozoicomonas euniceicola]|uniref:UBC core domain-containing protein n=1 Tax=Endozoicomonas euniceicola TaxID=1234143 RepID=A0ABY6GXZ7_9GAMM|nr:hypothetical protein [Endozoicomonas euniceicola]UYM17678.1 hypothetical protein NX720_07165 [Endozoicomonas euniceicola]
MTPKGLDAFLADNPLVRLEPMAQDAPLTLTGKVLLNHHHGDYPVIREYLSLKVTIPRKYPHEPPVFEEVGKVIPKSENYHVNPDGSLCLGSPFRIMTFLHDESCFNSFYQSFFIPYGYAALLKKHHGIEFIFGELKHGDDGEFEDFQALFDVQSKKEIIGFLYALSLKKRVANKIDCFCGCSSRLGKCLIHHRVNSFRKRLPRCRYSLLKERLF